MQPQIVIGLVLFYNTAYCTQYCNISMVHCYVLYCYVCYKRSVFPCYTDWVCSVLEVELRPYTPAACLVGTLWAAYKVEVAVGLGALPVPAHVRHSHFYALWWAWLAPVERLLPSCYHWWRACSVCPLVKSAADKPCLLYLFLCCHWCSVDLCVICSFYIYLL